jgi:hypothetical protein
MCEDVTSNCIIMRGHSVYGRKSKLSWGVECVANATCIDLASKIDSYGMAIIHTMEFEILMDGTAH